MSAMSEVPCGGNGAVHSEDAQCQDCYKCLRHCPVNAIQVRGGHASVVGDRCIACGACVAACPVGAKRVRDDLQEVQALLASGRPVALSLAPSFVREFPGATPAQVTGALRQLGFATVSETALGAQEICAHLVRDLGQGPGRITLSSACPVAVDLIRKYVPSRVGDLTPVDSPLQAHARLLRHWMGASTPVVFAGPCIAKKLERDASPELLAGVLTFEDLHRWLEEAGLDPSTLDPSTGGFWPEPAREGARFPVEGGMIQALKQQGLAPNVRCLSVLGLGNLQEVLAELPLVGEEHLFLEMLACEGGCVRGPMSRRGSYLQARLEVEARGDAAAGSRPWQPQVPVARCFQAEPKTAALPDAARLEAVLLRLGKGSPADELNCGGCGYGTCRDLAAGILLDRAELGMCVSQLRKLAEKKANALFRTLPYGVVIVDQDLAIIESNDHFVALMGPEAQLVHEAMPGLAGARLEKFLPFAHRFRDELECGREFIRESHACGDRTLSVSIFTVEPGRVVGGLILDVTETERRRQEVVDKAEEVIQGMLANVQEIAQALGRNAARSEGILDSIIEAFSGADRRGGRNV